MSLPVLVPSPEFQPVSIFLGSLLLSTIGNEVMQRDSCTAREQTNLVSTGHGQAECLLGQGARAGTRTKGESCP